MWWLILCVNFSLTSAQIKHYFWVCLWGCFQMSLAFESIDSVKSTHPRGWTSSPLRAWTNKRLRREEFTPFVPASMLELGHLITSFPAIRLGLAPQAPLVLRPLDSDWITPSTFSGSPACRWQIIGHLSLHNHAHSPHNKFPIYMVLFLWRTLTNIEGKSFWKWPRETRAI